MVARHVDVGDRVTKGQRLATLDDTDARLELQSAQAEEAAARIDLGRAVADLDRAHGLFAEGHIAKAALDRATSVQAEATSRADRAQRARVLAENRLAYAALTAEAEGIVTEVLAEPGQVLPSGQPVVVLANTDTLDVVFALPEQDLPRLSGATATATLWDEPDRSYALTLRDVSPDVDPTGRTYRVRMWLEAPDAAVSLGRTATVTLSHGAANPVIALPLAAILNDGAGAAVWRVAGQTQTLERVPVEVAAIEARVALVRADLAPGDAVVSLGAHKLDPARPVRVVEIVDVPER
jgi:RND family efflux transporter MFP subunit